MSNCHSLNLFIMASFLCLNMIAKTFGAYTYADDSLVVRSILDTNGHHTISVKSVTNDSGGRIISLDLSNKPLGQFEFNISILPADIGNLAALKSLDIASNHLSALPVEICSLSSLVRLNLYDNNLTTFPSGIEQIANLIYLNLSINLLSSIPTQIGLFSKLQVLGLASNKIATLPENIGHLNSLKELNLSTNLLETLPDSIVLLNNLSYFSCSNNKICSLSSTKEAWVKGYEPAWPTDQQCGAGTKGIIKKNNLPKINFQSQQKYFDLVGRTVSFRFHEGRMHTSYHGVIVFKQNNYIRKLHIVE